MCRNLDRESPVSRPNPRLRQKPFEEVHSAAVGLRGAAVQFFIMGTRDSEKDRLAFAVADRHADFKVALAANRSKYPIPEFRLFAEAVRNYAEKTRSDDMVHRIVVGAVNGLVEDLAVERKRTPGEVLSEADRLECLVFLGYDPNFDGDEPPGLKLLVGFGGRGSLLGRAVIDNSLSFPIMASPAFVYEQHLNPGSPCSASRRQRPRLDPIHR
jgi:hypothetical protein